MTIFYTKTIRFLFTIITLFCTVSSFAMRGRLYSSKDQLSSSMVHYVYQDHQGFIWICTENGLDRYDGYKFVNYDITRGLPSDNVNTVYQGRSNDLYIGTTTGLCVMHNNRIRSIRIKENNGTRPFDAYITDFCKSSDGTIYVSTSGRGLWRINNDATVTKAFDYVPNIAFIQSMTFDRKGTLWLVTNDHGVVAIKDKGGKAVKRYNIKETTNYAILVTDPHDNVYVGYVNGGLYKMDTSRREFVLIPSTANLSITSLMTRKDGNIFVGTNGSGLKLLDAKTGYIYDDRLYCNEIDMAKTKVYSIMTDNTGNLWLALLQKGVFMQPKQSKAVRNIGRSQGPENQIGEQCVMSVFRRQDGTLWVGTDQDGLYALDSNGRLIKHYAPNPSSPNGMPGTIMTITEDQQGRLWIGSYLNGCGWINTATGEYHRAAFSYGKCQSVTDLRMGRNNNLWIGTLGDGVKCINLISGQMKEYRSGEPDYSSCLTNNFVQQMEIDPEGKYLFVGSTTGLSCLDIKSGRWDKVVCNNALLNGTAVGALRYDKKTGIWAGNSEGLHNIRFTPGKPRDFTIRHYTTANGLSNNHVQAIELDRNGQIWVSTTKGLCCLDTKSGKIKTYYGTDGVTPNEYGWGVSYHGPNDEMYFGGTQGLTIFSPQKITKDKNNHNIMLTQMLVGGKEVNPGDKSWLYSICDTAVTASTKFDLCHDDNNITLCFSTLIYSGQTGIRFRYSINGERWITMGQGENELTLSRLVPGDYRIKVEATHNGTKVDEKEWLIIIHNPWYLTPVAKLIYLIIIIALILYYLHIQKTRNEEKLKLQEHIHAEELNEQKLRSFINLSHEIRTPMTLILTPLLQLMKEDKDSHRRSTYDIIRRNSERILHLVNQIMDIRKIDKGQMDMRMSETNMVGFVEDVTHMFSLQAANKQIEIHFLHEDIDRLPVWIDRAQFDKVLINLMSNAVKYAPAGGEITVSINTSKVYAPLDNNVNNNLPNASETEGYVTISVFNTGEKIPESSLTKIFERFYQVSSASFQYKTGTGVGLDLARSIVMLHHGAISATNRENGAEFCVTLPLGRNHLTEEEIAPWKEDEHSVTLLRNEITALEETNEEEEETDEANTVATPTVENTRKAKIVIVEDDDEIRNYLHAELSSTYRVVSFSNGAEALPAILRTVPQLVISDVMMPNMDGYTLCTKIKQNVNTNHVPVILVTAKTRDEDKMEGLETGADLFVTKPFNLDILRRNIANLIASRKIMQNKFTGKEELSVESHEDEADEADKELINRIIEVINENLYDSDLNIDMVCDKVGISRVHLNRKMKELTNQTPHAFIRNLRIKAAARLLHQKNLSISDVMWKCGFNSPTAFSTTFRKVYGQSPRDYRKEIESKGNLVE